MNTVRARTSVAVTQDGETLQVHHVGRAQWTGEDWRFEPAGAPGPWFLSDAQIEIFHADPDRAFEIPAGGDWVPATQIPLTI